LVPIEPMGFTTKEADEEIGVTYFGERWLIPRLGRWATPDPLHVHAAGGGETGNSYHYVSGNLLQAVDPFGLDAIAVNTAPAGVREGESFVVRDDLPHGRSDFRDEQSFQDFARGAQVFVYDRSAPHSLAEVQEFLRTMASLPGATGAGGTQSGPGGDGPTPGDLPHFGTGRAETGSGLGTGEDSGECTGPICSTLPGGGGSTQAESGLDLVHGGIAATDPTDAGSDENGGVAGGGDPHGPRGARVQCVSLLAMAAAAVIGAVIGGRAQRAVTPGRRYAFTG
jgi:RHS repeat-associated protein